MMISRSHGGGQSTVGDYGVSALFQVFGQHYSAYATAEHHIFELVCAKDKVS